MRFPVVFADEPAFLAEAQVHKTRISDHDGLEPQQFFKGQRMASRLANGAAPTLNAVLRGALSFDSIARL